MNPILFTIESVEANPDGSIEVQGSAERWGQSMRWIAARSEEQEPWRLAPAPRELEGAIGQQKRHLVYDPEDGFRRELRKALKEAETWGELEIQSFGRSHFQLPLPF